MGTTAARPLRRDAERNRQRILDAAGELFASRGLGVSLDDIAHHAGVGVGTVYRRFPDRDLLIDALFETRLDAIVACAHESLGMDDAWAGLVHFLTRSLELQVADRGLKELLLSASADGEARIELGRARIQPLVDMVLERAQAAGAVRDDITGPDMFLIQHAISEVADLTHGVAPDAWRRVLSIALDGLRPDRRRPSPMPAPALDHDQMVGCMCSWQPRRRR